MHEFSTSQAIADFVLDTAKHQRAKKVLRIEIEIGELTFLSPEQVEFWLRVMFEKTVAAEAKIKLTIIAPQIACQQCDYKGKLLVKDDPAYHVLLPSYSCPQCGTSDIRIEKGKECLIKRVEILR